MSFPPPLPSSLIVPSILSRTKANNLPHNPSRYVSASSSDSTLRTLKDVITATSLPSPPSSSLNSDLFPLTHSGVLALSPSQSLSLHVGLRSLRSRYGIDFYLWGHFFGLHGDYWVAEAEVPTGRVNGQLEGFAVKEAANSSGSVGKPGDHVLGRGLNTCVYAVLPSLSNPSHQWESLPLLIPTDLSSISNKFFSGRLSEDSLRLRATIAMISHETHIAPAGSFQVEETEGEQPSVKDDENEADPIPIFRVRRVPNWEVNPENIEDLTDPSGSSWQHLKGRLRQGGAEEEDGGGDGDLLIAADQYPQEAPISDSESSLWKFSLPDVHSTAGRPTAFSTIKASHTMWNGAHMVVRGGDICCFYEGWGNKEQFKQKVTETPIVQNEFLLRGVEDDAEAQSEGDVDAPWLKAREGPTEQDDPKPVPQGQNENGTENDNEEEEGDEEEEEEEDPRGNR